MLRQQVPKGQGSSSSWKLIESDDLFDYYDDGQPESVWQADVQPQSGASNSVSRILRPTTTQQTAEALSNSAKRERYKPKPVEGLLYPRQVRERHRRPTMSDKLTDQMVEQSQQNSERTNAERILDFDQSPRKRRGLKRLGKRRGLKRLGLSRNHLTADSSVATIVAKARNDADVQANPVHMENFLRTLGGQPAVEFFSQGIVHATATPPRPAPALASFKKASDAASVGLGNVRVDNAERNTQILHGYDWATNDRGEVTPQSSANHAALRQLWRYPNLRNDVLAAGQGTIVPGRFSSSGRPGYLTSSPAIILDMQDPDVFRPPSRSRIVRSNSEPTLLPSRATENPARLAQDAAKAAKEAATKKRKRDTPEKGLLVWGLSRSKGFSTVPRRALQYRLAVL